MMRWLALCCLAAAACGGAAKDTRTHRIARGDLVVGVEASGTLRAVQSSSVSPPTVAQMWDFKIGWMAPESSKVKQGQPVVRFDPSELERELEQKRAEQESAAKEQEKKEVDLQSQLLELDLKVVEARGALRRAQLKSEVPDVQAGRIAMEKVRLDLELAKEELKALEERRGFLERSGKAEVASLREQSERARQRVEELEASIERLNVAAPRDGLIVYRADWRGQKKKVGDTVSVYDQLLEIPDLARMEADAEIDEADAGRVAVGQRVTLRIESHPELEYAGRVSSIAPIVTRQSRLSPLKVYKAVLALDVTDTERMRPGMRFRAEIEVERKASVLLVPLEAVDSGSAGPSVRLARGGGGARVSVELGARNKTLAEVLGGLQEGQTVELEDGG